jgi:hypothetical protein
VPEFIRRALARLPQTVFDVVCEHADDEQEVVLARLAEALRRALCPPEPEAWDRAWDM